MAKATPPKKEKKELTLTERHKNLLKQIGTELGRLERERDMLLAELREAKIRAKKIKKVMAYLKKQ